MNESDGLKKGGRERAAQLVNWEETGKEREELTMTEEEPAQPRHSAASSDLSMAIKSKPSGHK